VCNATYFESHGVDLTTGLSFGVDMTPLILDDNLDPNSFLQEFIQRFSRDVAERLQRLC
jgi:hypothetical protein